MKISVSFLSSSDKGKDLKKLNLTDVEYIHVDYMDGKFVSNKSLPYKELKKIYKYTSKRLDVHLMAVKPSRLIKKFALLNTEFITVHIEIKEDINKLIDMIHSYGIKAGISINPDTDISLLEKYIDNIDMILVMSVYPGKGGQEFIDKTPERIIEIKRMLHEKGKDNILISVDGGINDETAKYIDNVDILVSGSYIVKSDNFQDSINKLR